MLVRPQVLRAPRGPAWLDLVTPNPVLRPGAARAAPHPAPVEDRIALQADEGVPQNLVALQADEGVPQNLVALNADEGVPQNLVALNADEGVPQNLVA